MIVDRRFRRAYCLHHQTSQKTTLNIILAAVRTWNLTRKGLFSLSLCAIVLRSSPPSHVSTCNGQRSSQLFCVHYNCPFLKNDSASWSQLDSYLVSQLSRFWRRWVNWNRIATENQWLRSANQERHPVFLALIDYFQLLVMTGVSRLSPTVVLVINTCISNTARHSETGTCFMTVTKTVNRTSCSDTVWSLCCFFFLMPSICWCEDWRYEIWFCRFTYHVLVVVVRGRQEAFFPTPLPCGISVLRATVEWYWQEETEGLGGKICASTTLSTTNPTWTDAGANPGLRC
jgi:hypothetical protein